MTDTHPDLGNYMTADTQDRPAPELWAVGNQTHDEGMWMAQDDANPRRRTAFGSEEAARRFAEDIPGWSVFSDQDDRWRLITGRPEAEPPGDA